MHQPPPRFDIDLTAFDADPYPTLAQLGRETPIEISGWAFRGLRRLAVEWGCSLQRNAEQ